MNSRCRRFNVLLFDVLPQSDAAIIAAVAAHVAYVVAGDRSTVTGEQRLVGASFK